MSEKYKVDQLFHRIHLFITEGQVDIALATLAQISDSDASQKCEMAYLRAWCATLCGNWDAAAAFLSTDHTGHEGVDLPTLDQTERRRRVYYLLLLGQAANKLGYFEEATRHYTQCIKFLDERRMNILSVRIKARCGLGRAYTQIGFYAVALAHYENALHLCGPDKSTHPDLLEIQAGLCTVHRCLGNIEQALLYGQQALQLCRARGDASLEGRIHNLLGQAYFQTRTYEKAICHYTEALELAECANSPESILTNLTALAVVRLEEGQLEEARYLYERGLTYQTRVSDARLIGALYLVGGKIAEESQAAGEQAISCYQKAEVALTPMRAKAELAEVYGRLAQILEATGRQNEAIAYWKSAYTLNARPEGSPVA